jgi:hypothetical protein
MQYKFYSLILLLTDLIILYTLRPFCEFGGESFGGKVEGKIEKISPVFF